MVLGMLHRMSVVLATVAIWAVAIQVQAVDITTFDIGAFGDSYSTKYTLNSRNQHRSWVQQIDLAYSGSNLFGNAGNKFLFNKAASAAFLNTPGAYRVPPYEYSSILDDQLPDLQTAGVPDIVVLFGGANDFYPSYNAPPPVGVETNPAVIAGTIVPNIQSIVSGILDPINGNANTKIVIVDVLARSSWPNNTGIEPPNAAVTSAVSTANNALEAWASSQGIPVVLGRELQDLGVDNTLTLAGLGIAAGTTSDNQPANSWFADGAHGGTIFQGALANTILTALELGYGINSTLLDWQADIFSLAYSLDPNNSMPTGLDASEFLLNGSAFNFSFADYVVIPEPATAMLLALGALLCVGRSRRAA